jgi:tetratricopeptide (TPR) repeat protein
MDMADSDGATELSATERAEIDRMFVLVETGTLYALLGVRDNVDRKAIRDAYFKLSKQFHPDAFYGRNLGLYRARIEAIFRALTNAYDVLSNRQRRAEYDRSVGLDPGRALVSDPVNPSDAPPSSHAPPQEVKAAGASAPGRATSVTQSEVMGAQRATSEQQSTVIAPGDSLRMTGESRDSLRATAQQQPIRPPPVTASREPIRPPPVTASREPIRPPPVTASREPLTVSATPSASSVSLPDEVQRAAREALARKLAGGRTRSQPAMPTVQPGAVSAGASLQAQFAHRPDLALRNKLASLRQTARELLAKGDWIGASNTMQIAVAMAPEDAAVKAEAEEVQRMVNVHMALQHTEAAREAERMGHWERAALLWGKVASVKPEDFECNYHLAKCLLALGKELSRAAEAARRAMAAAPRRVEPLVLLAEIFEAAGKPVSAKSAAAQAAKLDPTSSAVKDLLARLR